ncbi:hypothetical protein N6H14_26010 [Paenibacillus sp. CC-CFT747]|nr:hypothetical protein N6H14_26010 [Paenibacillus sp. CC-CFT747]
MRRMFAYSSIGLLALLAFFLYHEENQFKTMPADIKVEAALETNPNPGMKYSDLLLEVDIHHEKDSE